MTGTGLLAGAIAIALTTTAATAQRIELSPFAGVAPGHGRLIRWGRGFPVGSSEHRRQYSAIRSSDGSADAGGADNARF